MVQVVEQTREEKIKMYLKCSKRELAEMLINCNDLLRFVHRPAQLVSPYEGKTTVTTYGVQFH